MPMLGPSWDRNHIHCIDAFCAHFFYLQTASTRKQDPCSLACNADHEAEVVLSD